MYLVGVEELDILGELSRNVHEKLISIRGSEVSEVKIIFLLNSVMCGSDLIQVYFIKEKWYCNMI